MEEETGYMDWNRKYCLRKNSESVIRASQSFNCFKNIETKVLKYKRLEKSLVDIVVEGLLKSLQKREI